jgi:predicted nucleotidyltransferase
MNAYNRGYSIEEIKNYIVFETVSGSKAYGTDTPESDTDIRGVFVQPLEDVLKYGRVEQVSDETNDVTYYEIGRFIKLLSDNNPNVLELIAMPESCIRFIDPLFKEYFYEAKEKWITKKVRWTFAGYAIAQIDKAQGYNKKINWEEAQMTRKTVLDFCYILVDGGSQPFKEWLKNAIDFQHNGQKDFNALTAKRLTQDQLGLAAIDHARDLYAMYERPCMSEEKWGIVSNEETSNQVQLISIPKGAPLKGYLSFNKDGYTSHCKKYKEYQTWLKERNPNRFKMNKAHGKNYDSKNMMHTYRLLLMAHELAKGELRVRRTPEEIEKLMKIRTGVYEYEDLLKEAIEMKDGLDAAYEKSTLPDDVDLEMAANVLYEFRRRR